MNGSCFTLSIMGLSFSALRHLSHHFLFPFFLLSLHMHLWIRHNLLKLLPCWFSVCGIHRQIQEFFRGGLRDKFIRMCIDCIAVRTQLLG